MKGIKGMKGWVMRISSDLLEYYPMDLSTLVREAVGILTTTWAGTE